MVREVSQKRGSEVISSYLISQVSHRHYYSLFISLLLPGLGGCTKRPTVISMLLKSSAEAQPLLFAVNTAELLRKKKGSTFATGVLSLRRLLYVLCQPNSSH